LALDTETFEGSAGGANLALPAQSLDDSEARYIQDGLTDRPGILRRRGPVTPVPNVVAHTHKGCGLFGAIDPKGDFILAAPTGDASNGFISLYSADRTTKVDVAWPFALPVDPPTTPARIVDAKPLLNGGAAIGISSAYDADSPSQGLAIWRGGNRANYTTGTITFNRGSTSISGSGTLFVGNVSPGMFLFAETSEPYYSVLIGVVQVVTNNTTLVLEKPAPFSGSAKPYTLQSIRGLAPKVVKGRVTFDVNSTTVVGANTKFLSQQLGATIQRSGTTTNGNAVITGLSQTSDLRVNMIVTGTGVGTGAVIRSIDSASQITLSVNSVASGTVTITFAQNWHMYRASDNAYIGRINSVATDISVALAANPSISGSNERYIALRVDSDYTILTTTQADKVGFLNASYAERQWYANQGSSVDKTERIWFSDPADPEGLDLSPFDGDFLPVASTKGTNDPIVAILACASSVLVLKEKEVFGIFGNSPTTFQVRKIWDDGALSGMSVVPYGSGAIWAGRDGIHYFDGIQVRNLVEDKLGDYWKTALRNFNPMQYRMWGAVYRDHYLLYVENQLPTTGITKAFTTTTPTRHTYCLNLVTRAPVFLKNIDFLGFEQLPADQGNTPILQVNDATIARLIDASSLFESTGLDAFACAGNTAGPDFYFESKKFNAGDSLRRKNYKFLALYYLAAGGDMKLDTIVGLNNVGATALSEYESSGYTWTTLGNAFPTWSNLGSTFSTWSSINNEFFRPKKIKFQKRSQFLGFRLYQEDANMTQFTMGPYQLGFKYQRAGKV
jgi:hypothetical protein